MEPAAHRQRIDRARFGVFDPVIAENNPDEAYRLDFIPYDSSEHTRKNADWAHRDQNERALLLMLDGSDLSHEIPSMMTAKVERDDKYPNLVTFYGQVYTPSAFFLDNKARGQDGTTPLPEWADFFRKHPKANEYGCRMLKKAIQRGLVCAVVQLTTGTHWCLFVKTPDGIYTCPIEHSYYLWRATHDWYDDASPKRKYWKSAEDPCSDIYGSYGDDIDEDNDPDNDPANMARRITVRGLRIVTDVLNGVGLDRIRNVGEPWDGKFPASAAKGINPRQAEVHSAMPWDLVDDVARLSAQYESGVVEGRFGCPVCK